MKFLKLTAISWILFSVTTAGACDEVLSRGSQNPALDARARTLFARDCMMQDRYVRLRSEFAAKSIRISDLAEYKVLRFINREAWEQAKRSQVKPNQIFSPAPITWDIWAGGLNSLFPQESLKNVLMSGTNIDNTLMSKMNQVLLTDGRQSIKDRETDDAKKPGDFRHESDNNVAFCDPQGLNYESLVASHHQSLAKVQVQSEKMLGVQFQNIFKQQKIDVFAGEQIGTVVRPLGPGCGSDGRGYLVSYVRSDQVQNNLERLKFFLRVALASYKNGKPVMAPTELSVFVQRWLVSIHPFADGNGRTSRAVQDLILANFDLPFAPTGDFKNDVLDHYENYVELSYQKSESMLNYLEGCLRELKSGQPRSFACRTTQELNTPL